MCGTLRGGVHKYQFDYSENTAAGRLVTLLAAHASPGVVVDLGCGTAELAGPLTALGFQYVGYDIDAATVQSLCEQGIDARQCDLAVDDAAALVEAALDGRPLAAVTAIDVVEHIPDFEPLLRALSVVSGRHGALLGVSIPNVAHEDLAVKLLAGRWDVTELGLLDATHVNLFDERRVEQAMSTAGFAEVARNDVELTRTEQGLLVEHPFVDPHTSIGEWLRHLRTIAGAHATTYQFVRVYRSHQAGAPFDGTPPAAPLRTPTFTVMVLPGPGSAVAATVASVRSQRHAAAAVLEAPAGAAAADTAAWFVAVLASCSTTHACVLEAGSVVSESWLGGFASVLEHHPSRVARHSVAPSLAGASIGWGLLRTLTLRDEPLCAFAVPVAPASWLRLVDVASRDVCWSWVVRSAVVAGIVDVASDDIMPAVPRREAADLLLDLGGEALLLPMGWHHEFAAHRASIERIEADLAAARHRADAMTAAYADVTRSTWWRLTSPGRRLGGWLRARRSL